MCPRGHCSIIHNSQAMETIFMYSDGWIDKENVAYIHNTNEILKYWNIMKYYLAIKHGNPTICDNMNEPGWLYGKWN